MSASHYPATRATRSTLPPSSARALRPTSTTAVPLETVAFTPTAGGELWRTRFVVDDMADHANFAFSDPARTVNASSAVATVASTTSPTRALARHSTFSPTPRTVVASATTARPSSPTESAFAPLAPARSIPASLATRRSLRPAALFSSSARHLRPVSGLTP